MKRIKGNDEKKKEEKEMRTSPLLFFSCVSMYKLEKIMKDGRKEYDEDRGMEVEHEELGALLIR